jgi:anion-transporting  ArsA/GET3 family ATPase
VLDKRFIVIGGKGGVGRTTVAVSLAVLLSRRGRRVLLAHVRTRQRVAQMIGTDVPIDEEIREVQPNLWVVNMTPEAALREKGLMVLRFKAVYRAVMENRVVRYFLRAVPALNEYSVLGKAWYHTTETLEDGSPRFETVIFDGPAMGHLISMLRVPQVIVETVPEGPLIADARQVMTMLRDPARTSLWIVTLAEEMPVRESEELLQAARQDLRIPVERLVVNSVYPDDYEREPDLSDALDRLGARGVDGVVAPLLRSARTIRARRRINRRYLDELKSLVPLPRVVLPQLFVSELDRRCIDELAATMERQLVPGS